MKTHGKISCFLPLLIILGSLALGEGWCVYDRVRTAHRARADLEQKRRELCTVAGIEPAPTAANAGRIEADLARTTRILAAMRAEWMGRGPAAATLRTGQVPERPADAYFDIAAFVERMREHARRRGVALKADERFGFAEYANAGPSPDLVPIVFHERLLAQYLLEALFEARPRQLVSVQRGRPAVPDGRATGADYFETDGGGPAHASGFVDATTMRLTFDGQTGALRAMLNKLATFELPLVVRSVEVEPAGLAEEVPPARSAAGADSLLVARSSSRFTLTVELLEPTGPTG